MVRVFVFLAAVQLVLVVLALISALSAERLRTMPRALWVLVILLVPLIGPVAYFLAGRPVSRPAGLGPQATRRPSAPDDDPDFLKTLDPNRSRRDRELFEKWERDMKRQSDEAARKEETAGTEQAAGADDEAARVEAARAEAARVEAARVEAARAEAARAEAARKEAARTEEARRAQEARDEAARRDETPPSEV
jgi:hypothetical protein